MCVLTIGNNIRKNHHTTLKTLNTSYNSSKAKKWKQEIITLYDVKALFTSVPLQPSIQIVKQRLQQDTTLPQRTSMSISQITSLLEFCLTHTYFLFQGKYYEQVQGAAMGSPISPLIANIFMEEFEVKGLQSFPNPPPFGSGLCMTHLSSTRQNTVRTYYNTSTTRTHTSSSQ